MADGREQREETTRGSLSLSSGRDGRHRAQRSASTWWFAVRRSWFESHDFGQFCAVASSLTTLDLKTFSDGQSRPTLFP